MFRAESPNCPTVGVENAVTLKNSSTVGSVNMTGCPVEFARSDPLTPRRRSLTAARTRAVSGAPDCRVNVSWADHSPKIDASRPPLFSHRRFGPHGSSA